MKKRYLVAVLLCFIFSCIITNLYASHVAGGELIYTWLHDSTYHVTFKFYRDCSGIDEPTTVTLCYKNNCVATSNYSITLMKVSTINNGGANGSIVGSGCPGYPSTCTSPGSTIPGYKEWWYEGDVTLYQRCSLWTFSVTVSARNTNSNLDVSVANSSGFYVEATLNNQLAQGNSSSQFTVKPVPYVCLNHAYEYNNGAYDVDNDSLGYEMVQPLSEVSCNSTPISIPFLPATPVFNLKNNPIATNNTFVIDTITGQLNFTPSAQGKYTLALRVTEYRNHVAIGTIMRDIQVQVIPCGITTPSVVPDTTTINLVDGKIHDCGGSPMHFCFNANSADTTAILVPSDNHAIVAPGSTLTYSGAFTNAIYGCFTWSPTTADTGVKVLTVTVTDSSCRPPGITEANTFTLPLYIYPAGHSHTDTVVCGSRTITLHGNGIGSYAWSVLPGGLPLSSLSCTTCQNPTDSIIPTDPVTTYINTSVTQNGCYYHDTVVVIPGAIPATPTVSGTTPMCQHDTLKLYAGDTTTVYKWTGPAAFTSNLKDPVRANFLAADTGIYYVVAQNGTCNSAKDSIKIAMYRPTYIVGADTQICRGTSVQLYAVGSTFIWSVLAGGSTDSTLNCLTCATPVATPNVSTSYVVSSNQPVCNTSDTITITVYDYPAQPVATSNTPVCAGSTLNLYAGTTALSYSWTGPNGFKDTTQNPVISNAPATATGIYHIIAHNGHCASVADSTGLVSVVAYPAQPGISTNSPLCAGSPFFVSAQDTQAVNYYWAGPGGFTSYAKSFTILNAGTQYAGLYTLYTAFPADTACISPVSSYEVVVKPKVYANIKLAQDSVCQGYPLTITYSTPGADSLVWSFSNGTAQNLSANPLQATFEATGKQIVVLDAYNGVCGDTTTQSVTVLATPPVSFTATPVTCPGEKVWVDANHTYTQDVSFTWNFGGGTVLTGSDAGQYSLLYNPPGTYVIALVAQTEYCASYPYYDTILAQPYPDAGIETSDISNVCSRDSVHFEGDNVPGYHYNWQPATYFNADTVQSTYALVRNSGYIYLTITDQYGCTAGDSVFIAPHPCCNVYFPNSFTPNGDGKNDVFRPISNGHHEISYFGIFNRWGQEVYSSIDEQTGWNGTIKGVAADADTYFYIIKYRCVTGDYFTGKGEILLIR